MQYGTLYATVYAENEEAAEEKAYDYDNRIDEEYCDCDDSGYNEFDFDDMQIELHEEDVEPPTPNNRRNNPTSSKQESCPYFLNEINQI
ncbi:MAG: hypothetical protein NTU73_10005 [Ignavibacteriae bacterium]|nr:hypothetical protein [Ignavibacteriota bacterium]